MAEVSWVPANLGDQEGMRALARTLMAEAQTVRKHGGDMRIAGGEMNCSGPIFNLIHQALEQLSAQGAGVAIQLEAIAGDLLSTIGRIEQQEQAINAQRRRAAEQKAAEQARESGSDC